MPKIQKLEQLFQEVAVVESYVGPVLEWESKVVPV